MSESLSQACIRWKREAAAHKPRYTRAQIAEAGKKWLAEMRRLRGAK